ncbi:hypothetical protein [Streptomyces sp. NPDC017991]|uniref:hypothetical protein n=1 Tax=Streptomyces sp. NPDC017991 TaxID=3365026 RepID=UPI0037A77019
MSTADAMLIFTIVFLVVGWVLLLILAALLVLIFRGVRSIVDRVWGPFDWWHSVPASRSAPPARPEDEPAAPQDAVPPGYEDVRPGGPNPRECKIYPEQ